MTATDETAADQFDWSDITDTSAEVSDEPVTGTRSRRASGAAAGTGTRKRRTSARTTRLDALQKQLSQQMFMGGTMVGLALPVTGYYACQESDNFTKAVVQLAKRRSEWIEALEHLADIQPGILIGRTVIGLGAALAVDRNRVDPEKKMLQFLGVTAAWYAVNNPDSETEESSGYTPPPGNFTTL